MGKKSNNKRPFSVYLSNETIDGMKQYSRISGIYLTDLVDCAMTEYIAHHPLSHDQIDRYKSKMMNQLNDL